jgi:hypothetical protein
MKKNISSIVDELGLASFDEIVSILKEMTGEVKKRTIFAKLKSMEDEKIIFKIPAGENSYKIEGYVSGPNLAAEEDFDIKKIVVDKGFSQRDVDEVNWDSFSSRLLNVLMDDLKSLQEDLEKTYDDPKTVEMRYFDLSIKYHDLYGFFFDRYSVEFLSPAKALLEECKSTIDKKDM